MGNLASTYSALGRHSDALEMRESVLEFRRRVLPADHPDIGEGHMWSAAACASLLIVTVWSSFCFELTFLQPLFITTLV